MKDMGQNQRNEMREMNQMKSAVRTPKQKRERKRSIAIVFFAMLSFLEIFGCAAIFCYYSQENRKLQERVVEARTSLESYQNGSIYTQEEINRMLEEARTGASLETSQEYLDKLKELMLSGEGTVNMLRYFFPEQIVFANSGSYYIMDVNETLDRHSYKTENIVVTDDQIYEYYEDGNRVSRKGIDVSSFQGNIDWEKVAADGVEFAIIRMGIRGYGSGKLVVDEQFVNNMEGALAAGIDVGVYFFTAAISEQEAVEEAEFLLEAMEPFQIRCTVVLDVEDVNSDSARTNVLSQEQWTDHAIAFCERIKSEGYTPMIYGNMQSFLLMLSLERLEEYDKWFAAYTPYFYYPYDFEVWQYSDQGTVDGIADDVDLNISFYDWSSIRVGQ